MATIIRAELSKKNEMYISKHRYYELKHFCMQYPEWQQSYNELLGLDNLPKELYFNKTNHSDPTSKKAMKMLYFSEKMDLIDLACDSVDPELRSYIFEAVTKGLTYENLYNKGIPCSRTHYYQEYRYFFKVLDELRD